MDADWLKRVPRLVEDLRKRWSLTLEDPFSGEEGTCSWVAPGTRDRQPVVLKIGMPHFEGEHEIQGLRFWNGDPTVRLLESDEDLGAMLLERCMPGSSLRSLPETEQDVVIAQLLRRLWRTPPRDRPFRPLSDLAAYWSNETVGAANRWHDAGLVRAGLELFAGLPHGAPAPVVLATDLHAGNILRAQREPWLVIDPKPFVGDPAYDATQHLFNCPARMHADPLGTIERFSGLLGVAAERVRLWMFARAAAEPRESWEDQRLARLLAQ